MDPIKTRAATIERRHGAYLIRWRDDDETGRDVDAAGSIDLAKRIASEAARTCGFVSPMVWLRTAEDLWELLGVLAPPLPLALESGGEPTEYSHRTCRVCGCTDDDCSGCFERTGEPCSWVESDLCSACVDLAVRPEPEEDAASPLDGVEDALIPESGEEPAKRSRRRRPE